MDNAQYRGDIDGLRALAVVGVILYHFELPVFSGGYAGVDVFFVISGFLITGLFTKKDIDRKTILKFYRRRFWRLFPALFFTVAATFFIACLILSPFHLKDAAESVIPSLLGLSNFLFWYESGYFDTVAIYKPLLHTWSLAVETQFYLIWPLFLICIFTARRKSFIVFYIALLAIFSFILAQIYLQKNISSVFYLTPFRLFEFCIGAVLVYINNVDTKSSWITESVFVSGIVVILYSFLTYDSTTVFPGFSALYPCIGAAMCIFGGTSKYSPKLLSNRLMIRVGLISYSLYLCHWPIYIFYKYVNRAAPSFFEKIILIVFAFLVAVFIYKYIELPFKEYGHNSSKNENVPKRVFAVLAFLIALLSAHVSINDGWKWKVSSNLIVQVENIHQARAKNEKKARNPLCHKTIRGQTWDNFIENFDVCNVVENNSFVIMGDSHAADLWAGLRNNFPDRNFIQLTEASCYHCNNLFSHLEELLISNPGKISHVIFSQRSIFMLPLNSRRKRVNDMVRRLEGISNGLKIYWYGPQIEFWPDIPTLLSISRSMDEFREIAYQHQVNEIFDLDKDLNNALSGSSVEYVSKLDTLCPSKRCPVLDGSGNVLYPDYGHWSEIGGDYLTKILVPKLPR